MGLIGQGFTHIIADMEADDAPLTSFDIRHIIESADEGERAEWYELKFSVSPTCNIQFNADSLLMIERLRDRLSAAIDQRKARDAEIAEARPAARPPEVAG